MVKIRLCSFCRVLFGNPAVKRRKKTKNRRDSLLFSFLQKSRVSVKEDAFGFEGSGQGKSTNKL